MRPASRLPRTRSPAIGTKLTADANSMLYLNKANALFDISHGFDSYEEVLKSIKAKVLMVVADTDILFTATQLKQHFDAFQKAGLDVSLNLQSSIFNSGLSGLG